MGIEREHPWGGLGLTPEEEAAANAKRRALTEEGHGKGEGGIYDLDGLGEKGDYEGEVKAADEEDPEAQKAV